MNEKLLTLEELAEALNVSLRTVKNWNAAGILPRAVHEGATIRFDLPVVKRALARRAEKKAKAATAPRPMPDQVLTY